MKIDRHPVWVEWVDSGGTPGWLKPDEVTDMPMRCQTLGWLVKESKEGVVIALNGCFTGDSARPFADYITIPKRAILRRKKVRT